MRVYKRILRGFGLVLLLIASPLLSTSCKTCPRPLAPVAVSWPSLSPPPSTGIELAPDGRLLVPLDYWLDMVGYIREVDDVRRALKRQGMIVEE